MPVLVLMAKAFLAITAILNAAMTALLFTLSFNEDIKTARARFFALGFAVASWLIWILVFQI